MLRLAHNPRAVGAVAPSGPALARMMAGAIDPDLPGRILELGPGTGAITRGLVERGFAEARISAIEADQAFAAQLRRRFRALDVIEGDAFQAAKLVDLASCQAAVSGLPLLNFPAPLAAALIETTLAGMPPGAPFVQFSYGRRPPVPASARLAVEAVGTSWRNLPPARVWRYCRIDRDGA